MKIRICILAVMALAVGGIVAFRFLRSEAIVTGPLSLEQLKWERAAAGGLDPTRPVPPQVADLQKQILAISDNPTSYQEQIRMFRERVAGLEHVKSASLAQFLSHPSTNDSNPWMLSFKDEVMNQLALSQEDWVAELFGKIYDDKRQNEVIRDYAVQHLVDFFLRKSLINPGELSEKQADLLSRVLKEAAGETGTTIAGTALLGLSRLVEAFPSLDREEIAMMASQVVADLSASTVARISAIQACARLSADEALPSIGQAAEQGESISIRASAIAALGMMNQTNAITWLQEMVAGDLEALRPAARHALDQIAEYDRQQKEAAQRELDNQKGEQLRREKAARKAANTF
jgi:hypothetical protein